VKPNSKDKKISKSKSKKSMVPSEEYDPVVSEEESNNGSPFAQSEWDSYSADVERRFARGRRAGLTGDALLDWVWKGGPYPPNAEKNTNAKAYLGTGRDLEEKKK
jgi:hypothetical protein